MEREIIIAGYDRVSDTFGSLFTTYGHDPRLTPGWKTTETLKDAQVRRKLIIDAMEEFAAVSEEVPLVGLVFDWDDMRRNPRKRSTFRVEMFQWRV